MQTQMNWLDKGAGDTVTTVITFFFNVEWKHSLVLKLFT